MKKILAIALLVLSVGVLTACKEEEGNLRVAINYNNTNFITYNGDAPYTGLDGVTYTKGDLLPVWKEFEERIDYGITDVAKRVKNTDQQFEDFLVEQFKGVDLINGTGNKITANKENFVNLNEHLDQMPNLKKFIEKYPEFSKYLYDGEGAFYYTPYLDGLNEQELGFLMRINWAEKIIDGKVNVIDAAGATSVVDYTSVAGDSKVAGKVLDGYEPWVEANLNTTVNVTRNNVVASVVKNQPVSIITTLQNLVSPTGDDLIKAFRTYMTATYGAQGYAKLSDVFVGTDAAYDVDELYALMAVVKANPKFLRGESVGETEGVTVYFPREESGSRNRNMFRGLEMFGVRGVVSKNSHWLYYDVNGDLRDARHYDDPALQALERLTSAIDNGLVNPMTNDGGKIRDNLLNNANGFLTYDYNATSTTSGYSESSTVKDAESRFEMILPPVNKWFSESTDATASNEWFHFSESNRQLKNEAWGITIHAKENKTTFKKALQLVDLMYEETGDKGANLNLYGPSEWLDATKTIDYNGEKIPAFSEAALKEIADPKIGNGNMINYLRQYVGATLPIGHVRSFGLEIQTLTQQGLSGFNRVKSATTTGTFNLIGMIPKDKQNAKIDAKWYLPLANTLPLLQTDIDLFALDMKDFTDYWKDNNLAVIANGGLEANYKNNFNKPGTTTDWYAEFITKYSEAMDKLI